MTNKNHPITKDPSTKNIEGFLAKDENKSPEEKHEVRLINSTLRELQSSEWERIRIQFENFEEGTDTKFFQTSFAKALRGVPALAKTSFWKKGPIKIIFHSMDTKTIFGSICNFAISH